MAHTYDAVQGAACVTASDDDDEDDDDDAEANSAQRVVAITVNGRSSDSFAYVCMYAKCFA